MNQQLIESLGFTWGAVKVPKFCLIAGTCICLHWPTRFHQEPDREKIVGGMVGAKDFDRFLFPDDFTVFCEEGIQAYRDIKANKMLEPPQ